MNRLPDFLIIGAQKAGTTWLHQHLRSHPGIFMPRDKDQGFFCWSEGPQAMPLEAYCACFEPAHEDQRIGEATATYFWTRSGSAWDVKPHGYCDDIPGRILETLGQDTQLTLSLRDPVERAVSAYLHYVATGEVDSRTSLLDAGDRLGLIDIGFYAAHLGNWLRHFPLRQILVLDFARDIAQRPVETLARVYTFLGVDEKWPVRNPGQVVFEGRKRIWQDGEVWVPLREYPDAPARDRARMDGAVYCRRVDRATLNELRSIYAQDQSRLRDMLFQRDENR